MESLKRNIVNVSGMTGFMYEVQLIMLFSLNALLHGYTFRITNNVELIGALDDVVAQFEKQDQYGNMCTRFLFLQAKHSENPKDSKNNISLDSLTSPKSGKFSLCKYFQSFLKIKQKFPNFTTETHDLVIYTNMSISDKDLFEQENVNDYNFLHKFIKDSRYKINISNAKVVKDIRENIQKQLMYNFCDNCNKYTCSAKKNQCGSPKFRYKCISCEKDMVDCKCIDEFIAHIRFYVNQPSINDIMKRIKQLMKDKYSILNEDTIKADVYYLLCKEKFQSWYEKEITKIIQDDMIFFKSMEEIQSLSQIELHMKKVVLSYRESIKKLNIIFSDKYIEFMKQEFNKEKTSVINSPNNANLLALAKVLQALETCDEQNYMCVDSSYANLYKNEIEDLFKNRINIAVILVDKSCNVNLDIICSKLKTIAENPESNNKKLFIIQELSESDENQYIKYKLGDFNDACYQKMLSKKIILQGRKECVNLKTILNNDKNVELDQGLTLELLRSGEIKVGDKQSNPEILEDIYIDRSYKVNDVVDIDVIRNNKNDLYLIACSEDEIENNTLLKNLSVNNYTELMDTASKLYVCVKDDNLLKKYENLSENYKDGDVHYLELKNDTFYWKKSKLLDVISLKQRETPVKQSEMISIYSTHQVTVISDIAGMGKTTVLYSLAEDIAELHPNLLTCRINLNACIDEFKSLETKKFSIRKFIIRSSKIQLNEIESSMYYLLYNLGQIVVFFDGFDEILDEYQNLILKITKELVDVYNIKVVIATRPYCTPTIKKCINFLQINMEDINRTQQTTYLVNMWSREIHTDNDQYEIKAEYITKKFESLQCHESSSMCGIAIQLKMVSEVYDYSYTNSNNEHKIKLENLNHLYKEFIKRKIQIYYKKFINETSILYKEATTEYSIKPQFKIHQLLAADLILTNDSKNLLLSDRKKKKIKEVINKNSEQMLSIGVILKLENNVSIFIHRSIAEYLTALLIIKIWKKDSLFEVFLFCMEHIMCDGNYQNVRKFINYELIDFHIDENLTIKYFEQYKSNRIKSEETPLIIAIKEKNLEIIKYFLSYAEFNEREKFILTLNKHRENAWHYACITKYGAAVEQLLAASQTCINDTITNDKETALHIFSQEGDAQTVEILLKNGADCQAIDLYNQNALHFAATSGSKKTIDILLQKEIGINSTNENNETPLHLAVRASDLDVIQHLIQKGSDINLEDYDKSTPLLIAVRKFQKNILDYFLSCVYDINKTNSQGDTVLHVAARTQNLPVFKYLHNYFKVISTLKNNDGNTILHVAVMHDNIELLKYLLQYFTDFLLLQNKASDSVLHTAAKSRSIKSVEFILQLFTDIPLLPNNEGDTVLHIGAREADLKLVKCLLHYFKDFDGSLKNNVGDTILHVAAKCNDINLVQYISYYFKEIVILQNTENDTALHIAARNGNVAMLAHLSKFLKDISTLRNNEGDTVLQVATKRKDFESVKFLLQHFPNIAIEKVNKGDTLLHIAVSERDFDAVQWLSQFFPDILKLQNDAGNTVLHIAVEKGDLVTTKYLVQFFENNVSIQNNAGDSVLHIAVERSHSDIVKYLLRYFKYNAMLKNEAGDTVLHIAAQRGDLYTLNFLSEYVTDIETLQNNLGDTVLHCAAFGEDFESVQYLSQYFKNIPSLLNKEGSTVLHDAALGGNVKSVQYLSQYFKDISSLVNNNGNTVLHMASMEENIEILMYLLDEFTDIVSLKNNAGDTLLHIAAKEGNIETVKYLLENVSGISTLQNKAGETSLHMAAVGNASSIDNLIENFHEIMDHLLKINVNKDSINKDGNTALMCAALSIDSDDDEEINDNTACYDNDQNMSFDDGDDEDINDDDTLFKCINIMYLTQIGADINIKNIQGDTVLHMLARSKRVNKAIKQMPQRFEDMGWKNLLDYYNRNAYLEFTDVTVTEYLLLRGADVSILNNKHQNAVAVARENKNYKTLIFLKEHK